MPLASIFHGISVARCFDCYIAIDDLLDCMMKADRNLPDSTVLIIIVSCSFLKGKQFRAVDDLCLGRSVMGQKGQHPSFGYWHDGSSNLINGQRYIVGLCFRAAMVNVVVVVVVVATTQ